MDKIKQWILSVGLRRVVTSIAKTIVSMAAAHGIAFVGSFHGITINLEDQAGIAALLNGGFKWIEHTLATKWPSLSWLNGVDATSLTAPVPPGPANAVFPVGPMHP